MHMQWGPLWLVLANISPALLLVDLPFLSVKKKKGDLKTGGVVNFTMEDELEKATKIVSKLTTEKAMNPDALVPQVGNDFKA